MFNKTDVKEKLLTGLVFTGIFLPVRLLFYTYITTWWLGSFGMVTGVMLTVPYLGRKGKLGWLGKMINKQVTRVSKGKAGIATICFSIFFLTAFANMLYGMTYAPDMAVKEIKQVLEKEGITDLQSHLESTKDIRFDWWELLLIMPGVLFIMVVPTDPSYALFSIINGWTFGWMQHFMTVLFVQEIEIFGLVIYFRYFYKPNVVLSGH